MDTMHDITFRTDATEIKACCANVYQSDWVRLILGDSFHPGGLQMTEHLGVLINLGPGQHVLDVASGQGTSAIRLAQLFGCTVLGIDYSSESVKKAALAAEKEGVAHLVSFRQGDAECLPVSNGTCDAVICECAFCTFPDKSTAAAEFMRVLKHGGRMGLSDLTRTGDVPEDLQGLLAWVACVADAQTVDEYTRYLSQAGLIVNQVEPHDDALAGMVHAIQGKLLGAELLLKLKKIDLPTSVNLDHVKALVKSAAAAVRAERFGYTVITATKQ